MTDRNFKPDSGTELVFEDAGSTDRLRITDGGPTILYDEGGTAALTVETDGDIALTQDIYLASGKGIYFDGGTTSANYLGGSDAYEVGTWTPTVASPTSGITAGNFPPAATAFPIEYTKVGNLVNLWCVFQATDAGNVATTDKFAVGSLPFVIANAYSSYVDAVFNINDTTNAIFTQSGTYTDKFIIKCKQADGARASGYFAFHMTYITG